MSVLIFGNNDATTLASPIGSGATSVSLVSTTGWPSPTSGQYFVMSFFDAATGLVTEIVHVTAISGTTATIVRGQEGTTALSWNAGDNALLAWTAGQASAMQQTAQAQGQTANSANDSGAGANVYVADISPAPSGSVPGMPIRLLSILNSNTGASTLDIGNGLGALPILAPDQSALVGGELLAGADAEFLDCTTYYQLSSVVATTARAGNVPLATNAQAAAGTNATHAMTPAAAASVTSLLAPLAGTNTWSALQTFSAGAKVGAAGVEFGSNDAITYSDGSNTYSFGADGDPTGGALSASSLTLETPLALASGGLGAGTASGGRATLGLGTAAVADASGSTSKPLASVIGTVTSGHVAVFDGTAGSIQDGGPLSQVFVSAPLAIATGGGEIGPQAHGLGVTPTSVQAFLVCKSSEAGYSVGDTVSCSFSGNNNEGRGIVCGYTGLSGGIYTQIYAVSGNVTIQIPNKSTGADTGLASGGGQYTNWNLILIARA